MRRTVPARGLRITLNGVLAIAVMILVATASFTSEANLLLLLFGISAGLVFFNLAACMRTVRYTDVERAVSVAAVSGRPFRMVYTVHSRRKWLRSWAVRIGEMPLAGAACPFGQTFIPMLNAGEERRVELQAVFPERGRIALRGIRITCGFPFGLFTCNVDIESPAELVVYPAVGRVRREFWRQQALADVPSSRRHDSGIGQDEFHGVREYRQGDNPRQIHWRRSARTGQLVVREHEPVRDSQVIVLLDPWPTASTPLLGNRGLLGWMRGPAVQAGRDPKVERLISAAATTVCEALDRGHRVGIIARGAVAVVVAPAGGRAHRQRLLNELALLATGSGPSIDQLIHGIRWSGNWNARCLLFTPRSVESHNRALRVLSSRSESVMMISPQSGWLDKLFDLSVVGDDDRRATP